MKDDAFEIDTWEAGTGAGLIDKVADWLMEEALGETDVEALVEGCCERLRAAGIPIFRAFLTFGTLHPLFSAIGFTWHRAEGSNRLASAMECAVRAGSEVLSTT